jgi:hypothetical protein
MKKMLLIMASFFCMAAITSCGNNEDAGNKSGNDRDMLSDTTLPEASQGVQSPTTYDSGNNMRPSDTSRSGMQPSQNRTDSSRPQ